MSRLFDRLNAIISKADPDAVMRTTPIVIDSVFNGIYIANTMPNCFPSTPCVPPFFDQFVEFRIPNGTLFTECGFMCWTYTGDQYKTGVEAYTEGQCVHLTPKQKASSYFIRAVPFCLTPQRDIINRLFDIGIFLDEAGCLSGAPIFIPHEHIYSDIGIVDEYRLANFDNVHPDARWCYAVTLVSILVVLNAFALMNCKNVELVDNAPPPKLSKKHEKRHGEPLVVYKTIKVSSATLKHYTDNLEALPKMGDANFPLHIMRGHFKDYRDGKGLFGRYKGVYWWDNHVRGDADNGIVIKDYEVNAGALSAQKASSFTEAVTTASEKAILE